MRTEQSLFNQRRERGLGLWVWLPRISEDREQQSGPTKHQRFLRRKGIRLPAAQQVHRRIVGSLFGRAQAIKWGMPKGRHG